MGTHPYPAEAAEERPTEAVNAPDGAVDTPTGSPADVAEPTGAALVEQAIRIAVGSFAIAIAALGEAMRRTLPAPPPTDEPAADRPDLLGVTIGAALGLTLMVGDRMARAAGALVRSVGPPAAWAAAVSPLPGAATKIRGIAEELDDRWRSSRPQSEAVAAGFARELVPEILDAVLDQIDLTWLVAERVDLDELIARVDLDAAVERVDIERIVARVDLDRIAAAIDVDAVVARVDLDTIVSRVDVDAVARRLDIDAVVDRIDLVALARYVIDEIDLPEIIRESSGSMASETVRGVRMQGIEADAAVARAMDRVLLRHRARDTDAPGDPESLGTAPPDDPDPRT